MDVAWTQVPMMTTAAPVNMPQRRPNISFTGAVKKTAAMEPMLYMAKTIPVDEPSWDLEIVS
jgi:hypothetical protein